MVALESIYVSQNALTGTVPPNWGSWGRVKVVALLGNPQLHGCLPPAWKTKVNSEQAGLSRLYLSLDPLTSGTNITGWC
jgi:hypothetical protein